MLSAVRNPEEPGPSVWPLSLSLAATQEIEFSFSSCCYLDVSVHSVPLRTLWIHVRIPEVCSGRFPHSDISLCSFLLDQSYSFCNLIRCSLQNAPRFVGGRIRQINLLQISSVNAKHFYLCFSQLCLPLNGYILWNVCSSDTANLLSLRIFAFLD